MKKTFLIILGLVLSAQLLRAQYENVNLLAQSPDGKTVKLIWFVKKWNADITGFDIKRKDGLQNWVQLNSEPILPEISAKKKISIVESDKTEQSKIRAKLLDLISANVLEQTNNADYLQRLNSDDKAAQEVAEMIAHDYSMALLNGFAFVDHTVTKRTDYEYGVFIQGTDKLLDSVKWNYGQIPDLNTITGIISRSVLKKNGIEVVWNADQNKIRAGHVTGYNIYREGIRLNSKPIVSTNAKDPSEFKWFDRSAKSNSRYLYSISAESVFGIEGIIKSYKYDPADHPQEYTKAQITGIESLGYYFKDGVSVKWTFPKEQERFIKGFFVEKDNMPDGFRIASSLMPSTARTVIDTSSSQVTGYINFRVNTVYNDRTTSAGIQKLYNYFPMRTPPAPQELRAKVVRTEKEYSVLLTWAPQIDGDIMTDHYVVYAADVTNDKWQAVTENIPQHTNSFTYHADQANTYRFCVLALSPSGVESPSSDTVSVKVPVMAPAER